MELKKVHQRLKQIQTELIGSNNFSTETSQETMIRLEKLSKEIHLIAVEIFGEEDEITAELASAILLSKDYGPEIIESESGSLSGALKHLQYGIALFLDKF